MPRKCSDQWSCEPIACHRRFISSHFIPGWLENSRTWPNHPSSNIKWDAFELGVSNFWRKSPALCSTLIWLHGYGTLLNYRAFSLTSNKRQNMLWMNNLWLPRICIPLAVWCTPFTVKVVRPSRTMAASAGCEIMPPNLFPAWNDWTKIYKVNHFVSVFEQISWPRSRSTSSVIDYTALWHPTNSWNASFPFFLLFPPNFYLELPRSVELHGQDKGRKDIFYEGAD